MRARAAASAAVLAVGATTIVALPAAAADEFNDLIISEYIEGGSFNKAVEIYNGTTADVDLTSYTLELYSNGASEASQTLDLTGTIAAGGTYVAAHTSASDDILALAQATSGSVINFNGDDALVLKYDGIVVDSFGQVGVDPGSEWTGGGLNDTLRRLATVCAGDTDPTDAFDAALEWEVYGQDVIDDLGAYASDCAAGDYIPAADGGDGDGDGSGDGSGDGDGDGGDTEEPTLTPISTIQGSGSETTFEGTATVQGVVVGDYQGQGSDYELSGFFIQSLAEDEDGDPATSEGLFVYNYWTDVSVGDVVTVTGAVTDRYSQTQITGSTVVVDGTATVSPTVVELPQPSTDYFERYEGMLVTFEQTLTATDVYDLLNYGETTLSAGGRLMNPTSVAEPGAEAQAVADANALNMLVLDDASSFSNDDIVSLPYGIGGEPTTADNPLRAGATVTGLTGVVGYSYSDWRLYSNGSLAAEGEDNTASFVDSNPRPTSAPEVGDAEITVASFNMLNFFETLGYNAPLCGPTGESNCRGASSEDEYLLQLGKHVETLKMLDADIVGLMEVENTVDVEALDGLVEALNADLGEDRYAVLETGLIGTDVIKVGLIYDQTTVEPFGDFAILDSTVDPAFDDTLSRPALAQTFKALADGETVNVIVNHLKSKNCYDEETGGDLDTGDGAGCYNETRAAAAEALVTWANGDPTGTGEDRTLMIGDYNSYEKEDPIDAILDGGYTSLVSGDDYSYVYYAEWGQLDYAFASDALADEVTGAAHLHLNADEASDLQYYGDFADWAAGTAYRSSDHDPVLVGLDLETPAPVCEVEFVTHSAWYSAKKAGGFVSQVWITNVSDETIEGWDLSWSWSGAEEVTKSWRADVEQDGADVTASSLFYSAKIKPGKTETFGFLGTQVDGVTTPTEFSLNGMACEVVS